MSVFHEILMSSLIAMVEETKEHGENHQPTAPHNWGNQSQKH